MRPPNLVSTSIYYAMAFSCGRTKILAPPRPAMRGTSPKAADAVPKRAIRFRKVTGPIFSVRASRSQSARSRGCTAFLPDARFGALQKPADIVAMHPIDEQRKRQRQPGIGFQVKQQEIG